jgi:hypothetical protein
MENILEVIWKLCFVIYLNWHHQGLRSVSFAWSLRDIIKRLFSQKGKQKKCQSLHLLQFLRGLLVDTALQPSANCSPHFVREQQTSGASGAVERLLEYLERDTLSNRSTVIQIQQGNLQTLRQFGGVFLFSQLWHKTMNDFYENIPVDTVLAKFHATKLKENDRK